ncbi:stage II sporulation protein M [Paenibacillus koleovorans]|uniref:stage II sporulation protein M n=1 Tax=Paenibacillus koleovorans TaxID=121608 RepID=UPI000FDB5E91|nr:stage II sporulation protein M [Paenibacillus koleovorans]
MDPAQRIKRHKDDWAELERLLVALDNVRRPVRAEDIDRLTTLYKAAATHLSAMRTQWPNDSTTTYLNHLVARAHHVLYRQNDKGGSRFRRFFGAYFPNLILQRRAFILMACALFLLGLIAGYAAVWSDPLNVHLVLPSNIANAIDPAATDDPRGDLHSPLVSTEIFINNIRVAMLAFVSGVTLGFGTVYLLVFNGLLIGALAAVFAQAGETYVFWAYILPHGIIELVAIFIAGGAGLYMGYRFFVPGAYTRKRQFLQAAQESVLLLVGTLPLFVIAGLIEGYITPSDLSLGVKYAVAGATLLLLAVYVALGSLRARFAPSGSGTR